MVVALQEAGALLREEQYEHKYPYDWRTKKPTIFRCVCALVALAESGTKGGALRLV